DWSSDVCSSDLIRTLEVRPSGPCQAREAEHRNQAFHPVTPHEHYVSSPTWMNRKPEAFQTSHGPPANRARRAKDSSPRRTAVGSWRGRVPAPERGARRDRRVGSSAPYRGLRRDRRSPSAGALGYYLAPNGLGSMKIAAPRLRPFWRSSRIPNAVMIYQ